MSRRAIVYHTDGAEIFCGYGKNIPCPDVDIISAVAGQLENFGYFRRHAEFLKQGVNGLAAQLRAGNAITAGQQSCDIACLAV